VATDATKKITGFKNSVGGKGARLIDKFGQELLKGQLSEEIALSILETVPTLLSVNVFSPSKDEKLAKTQFQSVPVATYFRCSSEGKDFNPDFNRLIACQ